MNTFLIRIELHHDEHSADYQKLHDTLYAMRIYRVVYSDSSATWYDLPSAMYLFSNTYANLARCLTNLKKIIEQLLREHNKYPEITLPSHYSLLVTEVAVDGNGKIKLMGDLQKTADASKLPPSKTL